MVSFWSNFVWKCCFPPWERIAPIVFFIYRQNQIKIIVQHSYSVKISCALNKRDQADLSLPYGAAN